MRSCTSPAVSSGPMGIRSWKRMSPVSISAFRKKVVTPVSVSPFITAQLMGAAPRYLGRREPCRLKAPSAGMLHTASGNMRKATTTCRLAFRASNACKNAESLSFSGCSTGKPRSTAKRFTADCRSCCLPRPPHLSVAVTTPAISYPLSSRMRREGTANSGVPIKTMRGFMFKIA